MIGEGVTRIIIGCRTRTLRQHRAVPGCPVVLETVEDVLVPVPEIGSLPRVLADVEQELVAGDTQVLPVAVAYSALLPGFETPEQLARMGWRAPSELRQEIVAVWRIGGVGLVLRRVDASSVCVMAVRTARVTDSGCSAPLFRGRSSRYSPRRSTGRF
jgi:hypothetical protein